MGNTYTIELYRFFNLSFGITAVFGEGSHHPFLFPYSVLSLYSQRSSMIQDPQRGLRAMQV